MSIELHNWIMHWTEYLAVQHFYFGAEVMVASRLDKRHTLTNCMFTWVNESR